MIKGARFYALHKIRADNGGTAGRINIYGDINSEQLLGDEFTPKMFLDEIKKLGKVEYYDLHIYSNGGDVFAGLAIYSAIRQLAEPVNGYIEGICASIATVISSACDKVYIAEESLFMVHQPYAAFFFAALNINDAEELIDELKAAREPMLSAYTKKTGKTKDEIISALDGKKGNGTWFTAQGAIDFGFADDFIPDDKSSAELAACVKPGVYNYKGHKIDMSIYPDYEKMLAKYNEKIKTENSKGVRAMAKFTNLFANRKKPKAKAVHKVKAELLDTVCPYCNATNILDTETSEVSLAESATGTEEETSAMAKRLAGNIRNEIFSINCLECGEEYFWDTDDNSSGDIGEGVTGTEPANSAESGLKHAVQRNKPAAKKQTKPKAELTNVSCPDCGENVEYDPEELTLEENENGELGYTLMCNYCGASFFGPVDDDSGEASTVIEQTAAYKAGIKAERERMLALDEMLASAPGLDKMILSAKTNGVSADTTRRNVIKALGNNPAVKGRSYLDALNRDAQKSGANGIKSPTHAKNLKPKDQAYYDFIEEYNKKGGANDA